MIDINSCKKKLIASILCANTIFLTMPVNVFASEITGITPTGNTYNIEAAKVSGSTGFRQYNKFNLDQGDIANLKFKDNYSKFVNLVDNQININGIVNTMKGNSFYNGHAIFVSPNGMVIGASGLLNVGSLSVLTPSQGKFDDFKDAYEGGALSSYEHNADNYKNLITDSKGNIVVNGKIIAREEVNLYGSDIKIGDGTNRVGIIAGYTGNETFTDLSSAESTFNSLVSNNITNADSFALSNGKIKIVANKESGFGDVNEGYHLKSNIDIKKADIGANEIDISSTAKVERQERIDLAEAKVNVEDSTITGDTVSITAKATQKKEFDMANPLEDIEFIGNTLRDLILTFDSDMTSLTSLWGVAGKADAGVTIKNSTINALKAQAATLPDSSQNPLKDNSVYIHAESSSETSENANFLTPTLIKFFTSDESKIDEFFRWDTYDGFEGARTAATVNIENSTINAVAENAKNIEISTDASSSLDANNRVLAFFLPVGLYGVGTETESKAIVKDSTLNVTNGDIDVTAVSTNENSVNITNDSLMSIKLEDAYIGMILNNTVKTTTEAQILSSKVNAKNLSILATNLSNSEAEIGMTAIAGTKDQQGTDQHGNSAVSAVAIMNFSKNDVSAIIKDSEVKTEEDTTVIAQSLHITSNAADATVDDKMVKPPDVKDQKARDYIKDKHNKYFNHNLFDKLKGKTSVTATQSATGEVGGAVVLSKTVNNTNAKIENSKIEAGDVTVQANTVDLLSNAATTDTQGEGKYGVSVSFIWNDQNNTTNAIVSATEIEADNVNVDATTELPMNVGKLTFGMKFPFKIKGFDGLYIGGQFASEANGKWDAGWEHPKVDSDAPAFEITGLAEQNIKDTYSDLKPKFRLSGFFNNLVQSNSIGKNASASASAVYNEVNNNTTASIENDSSITINPAENNAPEGALTVNSVNSVIGYNGLGLFDILIKTINYKIVGQNDWEYEPTVDGGKFGLGANFAWDNYTNNAIAKIENSSVDAEKGSINIASANEQSYFNVVMTGAKSEALGVDGSIHIQKIKGETTAQIIDVKGNDKSIKAKNISVDAGKAHIKTTAGKIERDDDTNQVKWKEQNPTAVGDAKYIREAKDEITNIVLQGAWTSQYEEVDNTVQENSAGVAVGASVNVTEIDRAIKATINNSDVEATNDLTVNAETYNQKLSIEIAAAFSGGVTEKEAEVENVQNDANNAQDDDENIFGNLFDNEDEYMRNPVGNDLAALQGQFSMSLAGAVDVTTDKTMVEASIVNSDITVGNNLKVNADKESGSITIGGTVGKSKKVGAGAAVNVYMQEDKKDNNNNTTNSVKSYIDGSTVEFTGNTPKLILDSANKNWMLNIAIGAGAAVNTAAEGKGFQAAVGGSASANTLKPTIEAYINNSTIGMAEGKSGNIETSINAKSDVDIYNIVGGGSLVYGAQNGVSAGAAFNYNNIKNTISAYIKDSTFSDIGKYTMFADADNNMSDWAIAGAIVSGTDGGAFSLAGAVNVDYIHDTINSKVINSSITASDDIEVKANSKSDTLDVAGTFDVTTAKTGVGVNGNVVVDVFRNDITSEIDKNSKILKAKDVKVAATSTEKTNVIPVGLSVATNEQILMGNANVGINVIDNSVKSYASGLIGVDEEDDEATNINDLKVVAYDETTLYSRGGTVAIASADTIFNLAASVNVDKIDKTVEAIIKDAEIKSGGEVEVLANSVNSLGGTQNSEGGYTRDDVTTDEYKEKMLKKNSNGEYDDLKLGSDFKNWNMFYDIAIGSTVSTAGAGIGKVIENTITAEINNSKIVSDDLSVIAKDYSVKNIIAGSIAASSKAAAGLQAIYTRDNSTTKALITGGSKLSIDNSIEMLANNIKDSYEILVAGSGAGKGVINANVVLNNITDKTIAKIDNLSSENAISAQKISINSNEDINSSHIIVTAGGAGNLALSVSPTINNYDMTTESVIANANIREAAIDMDAQSKLGTLDISVGIAGAGQGLSGIGNAIKNVYTNKVNSYIDNSVIDTAKTIDIDANSIINSENWLGSLAFAAQGASLIVNLILNDIDSTVTAGIKNSDIQRAGDITINTNKDKKDELTNGAVVIGAAAQGVSASVNLIKNTYANTVKSYVDNTSSEEIDSLSVNAYSDRWLNNVNMGFGFAGEGASLSANALDNVLNSTTYSYVDAKSKTLNVTNALNLEAKDRVAAENSVAMIAGAGLGAAIGANINLFNSDNLAKTEIKSNSDGQIKADSLTMNSELTNAFDSTDIDVTFGLAAVPVDVQLIEIGKRSGTYSDSEQKTKIGDYVNKAKGMAPDSLITPVPSSSNLKTGAISSVNGNLKTIDDININAKSQLKGINSDGSLSDKFKMTNVKVGATAVGVNVAIRDVQNSNNTIAEIAGGKVESRNGNVNVKAESKNDVEIKTTEVNVHGVHGTGGSAIYNNSSETVAQIKDATVNAEDISVVSDSTSKSKIDATHVIASLTGMAAVDLAEATDTNKSVARITSSENGKTNITASGDINISAKANTDLSSEKQSVTVQIVDIAFVSKNKAEANTIARAIMENVNGEINANNLNISTNYDVMNVYSKANVVSVEPLSFANYSNSGSFMKADFKSGIDSPTALTLNIADTTNIITAQDTRSGDAAVGMVSKSEAPSVSVSIAGFYAGSFASAENTATSATVLNVKNNTTKNLNINQYLKSSAIASGNSTKVSGLGVSAIAADSKDTSTMTLDIAGANNITKNAIINATHDSVINSTLDGFSFGLLVNGARLRIDSELNSNTTGNIGGDFNAESAKIALVTKRNSIMSRSSGSGGFINVSNPEASNKLTGSSVLNVKNLNSDLKTGINNWNISNKSENTFDTTSSNGSGGFINVAVDKSNLEFDTSTNTNIENSNINSTANVEFEVENKGIIKDEATGTGGGFVAVSTNDVENEYKSAAKLTIKDTQMNVQKLGLKTSSDLRTKNEDYVNYAGTAGGFVAVNDMHLKNTLTQTSEIDIKNSILEATKDANVQALTSSFFKQKIESKGYGFVAVPRAYSTLEVNNTNKISLDNQSKIKAGDELDISFNSNNDLGVHTVSIVKNFEGKPSAYSTLNYTVNNTLENNGSLVAGNLADINFMNNSINNLDQYAHSECYAWIASTNEGGELKRIVNNVLNVNANADITSGKDVEITYSSGKNNVSSLISWYTESWPLGFPIGDSGSSKNDNPSNNYTLNDNGKIVAAQGNSRYMKINRDGTIDKTTLKGFYDDDYVLSDGDVVSGEIIKEKTLASIQIEIDNVIESIDENAEAAIKMNDIIGDYIDKKSFIQAKIDEINNLVQDGYILKNDKAADGGTSDFNTIIQNDIKTLIIKTSDEDTTKVSEEQYNTIISDYHTERSEIYTYNNGHEIKQNPPSITEFLNNNDYGLTEQQKITISSNYGLYDSNIVGDEDYQISQDQFDTISNAYQAKLAEVEIYNYGHSDQKDVPTLSNFLNTRDYGLTDAQKTTITTGYNQVYGNISLTTNNKFSTYQDLNGNKYIAVSNPTGTGTSQTCDEITNFNNEITNLTEQMQPYIDKRDAIIETQSILNAERIVLQNKKTEVENTPDSAYDIYTGIYDIVFNDINPKDAHIIVDGAYNPNITGSGIFSVASNGLKIDNYSTRSLVFNDLNIDSLTNKSGLHIGGKNHSEFANKNQAVSGSDAYMYIRNLPGHKQFENLSTSGVHYISSDNDGISGIMVNNYYDVNHPFASTFDIPFSTQKSNIHFTGDINTTNAFNVWNESGDITFSPNIINTSTINLYSTNGQINAVMHNNDNNAKFTLGSGSNIFSAGGLFVNADIIDIDANIKTGYTARNITITDDMLAEANLIIDPTSGEKNLVNLGGSSISPYLNPTNNIKAIYKDGQIYLYNLPEILQNNGVEFEKANGENTTGTISGSINIADGYQNIDIDNQTDKQLNISNVTNAYFAGNFKDDGLTDSNLTFNKTTKDHAETNITSTGKLSLNGVINNNLHEELNGVNVTFVPDPNGILNINAKNALDINEKTKAGKIIDSIFAGGQVNITSEAGVTNILGNITDKGAINILNNGTDKLNINADITDTEGNISVQSNGQTEITKAITANLGDIYIASKGLNTTENSKITDDKGHVTVTNNASAMTLNGDIKALDGTILFTNNGDSANIGGYVTDENGDIVIVNTKGDMTISSYISHDAVNQTANGMISITNSPTGGELNITNNIITEGSGKTVDNDLVAILIDNQSSTKGLSISETVSARLGDIIIKNNVGNLSVSGSVLDNEGNIDISSDSQTEISGEITAKEGNIGITSVGLDTTEDSIITTHKGNISINNVPYSLPDYDRAPMNLNGAINNYNGSINIKNQGSSAIVGGNIVDEKGNIFIINQNGPMTISADVSQNYLNQTEEGLISVTNNSFGEKLDITGNIINWGKGHKNDVTGITTAIDIYNSTSSSERTYISGTISARIGDIAIGNEYGTLTTTSTAEISNTENGNIIIENSGKNGADIRGNIIATEGNIGITNTKSDLYINADITEKKGNINITNAGNKLTYLGNTLNESGDTKVVNNGTGIAQIGASIDNTGNVTINNNNGQNLVFDGSINNYGNTRITNNYGFTHIYGDITNSHGSTIINNQGSFTEITSKINNDTGSIAISNLNGHFKITDTAEINNTSNRENSNIAIVNHGDDTSIPSNLIIDGKINSFNKGFIEIINNGDIADISGDIFAKDGDIGVTNSNDGKLIMSGDVVDYKGNVRIFNNSDDGAEIGGTILDEQGDIEIRNNGGDLKVTSEITHNYLNRDAEGMISIINTAGAGKVEIESVISTDGIGKTDDCGSTTAILIDNQSTSNGMSLNTTISARVGDIIIKNITDDLSTAGMISNYEQGNINITNAGNDLTNTADIMAKSGDVNITNNGDGKAQIGGSVNNENGNTTIANKGTNLVYSGEITNVGGNTTITNDNGVAHIYGNVSNKGGDILIANSGSFTEITKAIENEAGSIHISNSDGHLNITDTASITNTTDDETDSITIANAGANLNLNGVVKSLDKGDIEITNTGNGPANIAGIVSANIGGIDISNSNDGALNITGSVTDEKGNIDIKNSSADGAVISGVVLDKEGKIKIYNTGGDVDITGNVVDRKGDIAITNTDGDINISGTTLANDGDITIYDTNGGIDISGYVVDDKGDLKVINKGDKGTDISGTVLAKEGNATINNDAGKLDISGNVVDNKGDLKVINNGADGTSISGTILDKEGNAIVYNTQGKLDISGNVVDNKGKLDVINTSDELTTISGTVNAKDGDASVYTNGGLTITDTGYVVDDKGNLTITNKGGDGTDIQGTVLAKDGNATINNDAGKLDISGNVVDNKGDLKVINNGTDGTSISGTILDKEGNAIVYNTQGKLDISGNVVDNKGDLKVINNGADGTSISGTILDKEGNAIVYNTQGKLDISGNVVDNKGDLDITNTGDGGAVISGIILDKNGNTNIHNEAGDFTISGTVKDEIGNINITNNGGAEEISGTVLAQNGDINVLNTNDGALSISGIIKNEDGKINITNDSNDGMTVASTGKVTNVKDDTTIKNNAGDLTIENGAEVTNTESGNIKAENRGGKFTIAGLLKHFGIGNIDVNNLGNDELDITETGIVEATEGNIDIKNSNNGKLNIAGLVQNNDGKINVKNDAVGGATVSGSIVNVKGDTTITNNVDDIEITETGKIVNTESGNIKAENNGGKFTIAGLLKHFGIGNVDVNNKGNGELEVAETGVVATTDGTINVNNENAGGIVVDGSILSDKGETNVNNKSEDRIFISTTGKINNQNGNINVTNTGKAGIDVQGSIRTEKQNINITNKNSDLRIGEYDSDNDNYITAAKGNVVINQTNGNILNSITDPATGKKHQNADLGNSDHAYKTLIATGKNLVINTQDGDIGSTSAVNPGFSVDANTRDYTESINVNVKGKVNANALNKNNTDARLVNIRAKESDLKVENITSDGNIILTAADWKQPDTRPTPKDESYFKGYSVLNAAQGDKSAVIGQNISVIASDRIGTEKKPFAFTQDTKNAPNSSVSFEGENDVNILVRSNSKKPTKINQLISKRGDVGLVLDDDGVIREITAGDHLHILQRAKNLTIYDLGMSHSGGGFGFNDMLYPHDGLKAGGGGGDSVVPQSVAIEVLDSKGGDSADSNLKIYSAAVKGRNNGQGAYDKNGRQIADISLMADNIYANSAKAPDSTVETKANPEGYKQKDKSYSTAVFGDEPPKEYDAMGINAYGNGTALSFDITGVNKEFVEKNVPNATRTNYNIVKPAENVPDKFTNTNNQINDYDYKANNVVISVNDNVNTNRGVNINSIYSDNAYVNTKDSKLAVQDGYITNYAEFRNKDKIAVVDNDYRRIVEPADIQLYTEKTGSFALLLKDTINMHTTAPTVYNNPYQLVNGYHSAWNFVNRGRKEAEHQIENIKLADSLQKKYEEEDKRISMRFDTTNDEELQSNVEIYDISTTGALIKNDRNLKKGDEITISLKFEDVNTNVKAKVVNIDNDKAGVEFIRLPKTVASKILYRYMKQANSMKMNLTSLL